MRRRIRAVLALAALVIPATAWADADDAVAIAFPNHVHITTRSNLVTVALDPAAVAAAGIRSAPARAASDGSANRVDARVMDTAPLRPLLEVRNTFCRGSLPFAGRWGDDLLFALGEHPTWRTQLFKGAGVLVEVRAPSPDSPPPANIRGRTESGRVVSLRFVAPAGDGKHWYFFAPARFAPWTPVRVTLPGRTRHGVSLPAAAVVWWNHHAWVYVDRGGHRYQRQPVVLGALQHGRWFATRGVAAGERVVTRGAEMLLSAEQGGGISLGDDDD